MKENGLSNPVKSSKGNRRTRNSWSTISATKLWYPADDFLPLFPSYLVVWNSNSNNFQQQKKYKRKPATLGEHKKKELMVIAVINTRRMAVIGKEVTLCQRATLVYRASIGKSSSYTVG